MGNEPRFAFTKIFVDDLDAEAHFYTTTFGMGEKARLKFGEGRTHSRRSSSPPLETTIRTSSCGATSSGRLRRPEKRRSDSLSATWRRSYAELRSAADQSSSRRKPYPRQVWRWHSSQTRKAMSSKLCSTSDRPPSATFRRVGTGLVTLSSNHHHPLDTRESRHRTPVTM